MRTTKREHLAPRGDAPRRPRAKPATGCAAPVGLLLGLAELTVEAIRGRHPPGKRPPTGQLLANARGPMTGARADAARKGGAAGSLQ